MSDDALAITGIAISVVALLVTLATLAQPFWLPRFSEPRRRQREAADTLRRVVGEHQTELAQPDMTSEAAATSELRKRFAAGLAARRDDLSVALAKRVEVFERLLDHAERLDLRKETRWIEVATILMVELGEAAAREAKGRRSDRRLLIGAHALDDLIARGQQLQNGLTPLRETLWNRARYREGRQQRRLVWPLVASAFLFGFSLAALLFG
jgi:hypothetical protein